jgi:hypothetical protein
VVSDVRFAKVPQKYFVGYENAASTFGSYNLLNEQSYGLI